MAEDLLSKFSKETLELLLELHNNNLEPELISNGLKKLFVQLEDYFTLSSGDKKGQLSLSKCVTLNDYYINKNSKDIIINNKEKDRSEVKGDINDIDPLVDGLVKITNKRLIGYTKKKDKLKSLETDPYEFNQLSDKTIKSFVLAYDFLKNDPSFAKGMLAGEKKKIEENKSVESKALYKTLEELAIDKISVDDVADTFEIYFLKILSRKFEVSHSKYPEFIGTLTGEGKGQSAPAASYGIKLSFGEQKQITKEMPLIEILDFWEKGFVKKEELDKLKDTAPNVHKEKLDNYLFEIYTNDSGFEKVRPIKRMKPDEYTHKVNLFIKFLRKEYEPLFDKYKDVKEEEKGDTGDLGEKINGLYSLVKQNSEKMSLLMNMSLLNMGFSELDVSEEDKLEFNELKDGMKKQYDEIGNLNDQVTDNDFNKVKEVCDGYLDLLDKVKNKIEEITEKKMKRYEGYNQQIKIINEKVEEVIGLVIETFGIKESTTYISS